MTFPGSIIQPSAEVNELTDVPGARRHSAGRVTKIEAVRFPDIAHGVISLTPPTLSTRCWLLRPSALAADGDMPKHGRRENWNTTFGQR